MNPEIYTDRARGFIQSAQTGALAMGHQQFTPEHLLKVLLDDPEGLAAGLIDRSGGNSRQALQATEAALNKIPKVSGSAAGQIYLAPALARVFERFERGARFGDPPRDQRLIGDPAAAHDLCEFQCRRAGGRSRHRIDWQ